MLKRREQIQASEEKRAIRALSSFDYLMGIDDFSRMGNLGLRGKWKAIISMCHLLSRYLH